MIRLPKAILFLLIFISTPGGTLVRAQANEELEITKMLYADSKKKLDKDHAEKVFDLANRYAELLENVKSQFQQTGNLDGVLRVEAEQKAALAGELMPAVFESDPPEFTLRRGQYDRGLASLTEDYQLKVSNLRNVFLTHLKQMQSRLTRENRISEAIAVQNEVKALEGLETMEADTGLQTAASAVSEGEAQNSFRLVWGMPQPGRQALLITPGLQRKLNLLMDDESKLGREGLNLTGGRVVVEGMEEALFQAVQASGSWSLMVDFTPLNRRQSGPARIISYSDGTLERNFTFGQEMDRLVIRLRHSGNNLNGTNPEIDIGRILPRTRTKVVFSFGPDGALCYRDGDPVILPEFSGDFTNWAEMHLVIGNEWQVDLPWRGQIHSFTITNEALSAKEAQDLSKP